MKSSASAKVIVFVILLLLFPSFVSANWEAKAPLSTPRDQFTGGVINGKIYVFGGNGDPDGVNLKSTEMFDFATNSWTYQANNENNNAFGVEELTGAVVNGKLYVFGATGYGHPPGGVFNFVEEYDPVTNTWTSKASMPTTRSGETAAVYDGEIYVFGGLLEGPDPRTATGVVEAYNPVTNTWRSVSNIPDRRQMSAIVLQGNTAYLFGGWSPNTEQLLDDVLTYNFESGQWNTTGISLPTARVFSYSSAAPAIDGKVYLIGGGEATAAEIVLSDRVDIYDFWAGTWSTGPALPQATFGLTVRLGNYIYVIGGETQTTESEEDVRTGAVWRLQVSGPSSKAMPWILLLLDE